MGARIVVLFGMLLACGDQQVPAFESLSPVGGSGEARTKEDTGAEDTSAPAMADTAEQPDTSVPAEPVDTSATAVTEDTGAPAVEDTTALEDTAVSGESVDTSATAVMGDTGAPAVADTAAPEDTAVSGEPVDTSAPPVTEDAPGIAAPVDTSMLEATGDPVPPAESDHTGAPSEAADTSALGVFGDTAAFSEPADSATAGISIDTATPDEATDAAMPGADADTVDSAVGMDSSTFETHGDDEDTASPVVGEGAGDSAMWEGETSVTVGVDTAMDGTDTGLDTGGTDGSDFDPPDESVHDSGGESTDSGVVVDTAAEQDTAILTDAAVGDSVDSGGRWEGDTADGVDAIIGSEDHSAHGGDSATDSGLDGKEDSAAETGESGPSTDTDGDHWDGGDDATHEGADSGGDMVFEGDTSTPTAPMDDSGIEVPTDPSDPVPGDSGDGSHSVPSHDDFSTDTGTSDADDTGIDVHDTGRAEDTGSYGDAMLDSGLVPPVEPTDTGPDLIDSVPRLSVVAWDDSAFEGGLDPASFRFVLEWPHDTDLEVVYTLVGTAGLDDDYTLSCAGTCSADSIIIPAGETSVMLTIVPVATPDLEVEEWLDLKLSTHAERVLGSARARVRLYEHGPSNGDQYFLAPDGDDAASGDEENPFGTLQHAASILAAGDTLWVKDGVYTAGNFTEDHGMDGDKDISHGVLAAIDVSGTADNWITIAAEEDGNSERPIFRFDGSGGIQFRSGASFIRLEGLEIEGPAASIQYDWAHEHRWSKENFYIGRGIFSWGPVHHIVVKDCHVHHTPGSGIRFNSSDYIRVEGNTVANTTWWSSSAESAIVIATSVSIDEEDAVKFLYANNRVYNNWNVLEFCNRPLEGSTEDEYGNCDHYSGGIIDGQGLYVTRNNETYLYGRMRFENNIAYNNGFGGVVYHKTDRGELYNNLIFMNGAHPGHTNYSGLSVNTVNELVIANNVIWAREDDDYALKNNGGATGIVAQHNVIIGKSQFGEDSFNHTLAYEHANVADFFATVTDIDLDHPQPEEMDGDLSPAAIGDWIDGLIGDVRPPHNAPFLVDQGMLLGAPAADIDGTLRPQGLAVDVGPFEQLGGE